jgi:hypothetical protein
VFSRLLGAEVPAPGDGLHAERLADLGHPGAETAETQQAERLPLQHGAHTRLPAALADVARFGRQVPDRGEDQRPGELRRGGGVGVSGMADHDALGPLSPHQHFA